MKLQTNLDDIAQDAIAPARASVLLSVWGDLHRAYQEHLVTWKRDEGMPIRQSAPRDLSMTYNSNLNAT